MNKRSSKNVAGPTTDVPIKHLPLEQLTQLLRGEGFSIKPDDYIELLKVVEKFGTDNPASLKTKLCPLIATSEEEQNKFYRIFDEYVRITNSQEPIQTNTGRTIPSQWKTYAPWLLPLLLIGALAIYTTTSVSSIDPDFSISVQDGQGNSYHQAVIGDTAFVDAGSSFSKKIPDTSKVRIRWDFGNGWEQEDRVQATLICTKEEKKRIILEIASGKNKNIIKADTQYLQVCKQMATGIAVAGEDEPALGKSVILKPLFRGDQSLQKGRWTVNDLGDTLAGTYSYTFTKEGSYLFRYSPNGSNKEDECNEPVETSFEISGETNSLQLTALPVGSRLSLNRYKINPWWIAGTGVLSLFTFLFIFLNHRKARKNSINPSVIIDKSPPDKELQPPYDVPFENKDLLWVIRNAEMNPFFRSLRNKTEDDHEALNIPQTIKSVIRSGGIPSLVFTNTMKQQEYLVLIDQSNVKSLQLKFFEYLCKVLNDESINLERFYYSSFELFKNENYPYGISLQRLSELYKTNTLLILGNADQLIYPSYPVLDKEIAQKLMEWEFKGILTPVAYKDWGTRESLLKKSFILLPADPEGLIRLMQAVTEKQLSHDKYLSSITHFYETSSYDLTSARDLKSYMDNEILFQWLCAICVYPKLKWEMVIEMGKIICTGYSQPELLNYSNLLKLVRIPWIKDGSFPEKTRLELLKLLKSENELAARAQVLEMLKFADIYFKDHYFFSEEKKTQQLTNQFILFANDKTKHAEFETAENEFKNRWQQNRIFDGPLKVYLDKPAGGQWQTPILQKNHNPGLSGYFKLENRQKILTINKKFSAFYISLGILLLTATLFLNRNKIINSTFAKSIKLSIANTNLTQKLFFHLIGDSCNKNTDSFYSNIKGTFFALPDSFPISFNKNGMGEISVTRFQLSQNNNTVKLNVGKGKSVALDLVLESDSTSLRLRGLCKTSSAKPPLYLRYNNKIASNLVNQLINSLSVSYVVSAELSSFTDSSKLIYYSKEDESIYTSLASSVKLQTGLSINTEYVEEKRIPPAVPILFLNLTDYSKEPCTNISINSLPASISEIWSGSANNRFIRFDISKKTIFYSTGNKNTFGRYSMQKVCSKENKLKIIVKGDRTFRVFALRNIQATSFELSVCQQEFINETEAEAATDCDSYNKMKLYYESNPAIIYVPLNMKSYTSAEQAKINTIKKSTDNAFNANKKYTLIIAVNSRNVELVRSYRYSLIQQNSDLSKLSPVKWENKEFNGTPFDRDYINVSISKSNLDLPNNNNTNDPSICDITYYSIKEAMAAGASNVCKLNLSKESLSSIPKELYSFNNMQELDLGTTNIDKKEIQKLQDALKKCKITFQSIPVNQPPQTTDETLIFIGAIQFDKKDYINSNQNQFIENVGVYLKNYPAALVKLHITYNGSMGQSRATSRLNQVKNILLKAGASEKQLTQTSSPSRASQPNQQNQIQQPYELNLDEVTIQSVGINETTVKELQKYLLVKSKN
ncbi:MAG: hypothetical protein ACKVOW_10205 [Chitinophagaceae bacterium]